MLEKPSPERRRVNMTLTIPAEVKARLKAFAAHSNNRASRLAENAIEAFLGTWGTEKDTATGCDERKALVDKHLARERARQEK